MPESRHNGAPDRFEPTPPEMRSVSVPHQKFVVYFGEGSALLARRLDDEYRCVFGGEATQPAAWRPSEMGNELLVQHTSPDIS